MSWLAALGTAISTGLEGASEWLESRRERRLRRARELQAAREADALRVDNEFIELKIKEQEGKK